MFRPVDRIFKAIISPKDLRSDDVAWRSEQSNSPSRFCFRVEIVLDSFATSFRHDVLKILTAFRESGSQILLPTILFAMLEPAAICGTYILFTPTFAHAQHRHAIGDSQICTWIRHRQAKWYLVLGGPPREIAPHVPGF